MSHVTQRHDASIGTDFQQYLRRDPRSRGDVLAASPPREVGSAYASVSAERYTPREFHEREKARL